MLEPQGYSKVYLQRYRLPVSVSSHSDALPNINVMILINILEPFFLYFNIPLIPALISIFLNLSAWPFHCRKAANTECLQLSCKNRISNMVVTNLLHTFFLISLYRASKMRNDTRSEDRLSHETDSYRAVLTAISTFFYIQKALPPIFNSLST